MAGKLIHFKPHQDVPNCLRALADRIEQGNDPDVQGSVTVVAGVSLYHMGPTHEEYAAQEALFGLKLGQQILMNAAMSAIEESY